MTSKFHQNNALDHCSGVGKYLEGGKAAGGQLVDQRFCPRIVEGELRYNLIGDSLVGVIHKKPKDRKGLQVERCFGVFSAISWLTKSWNS